jgi:pimeloyl-ACP methyl ester carboxylesterase
MADFTSNYFQSNELNLHYINFETTAKRPLIMLHGMRSYAQAWNDVANELTNDFDIYALDHRGRGESDWDPNRNYFTDTYVDDLTNFVNIKGFNKLSLMGHSMGGANSIVYASRNPEIVETLVIVDIGPRTATSTGGARINQELNNTPTEFDSLDEVKIFWRKQRPSISEHALNERVNYTIKQLDSGKYGFKWDVHGIANGRINGIQPEIDMWDCVRKIQCPTLLIRGANSDVLQSDVAIEMIKQNSNITLIEIPEATHYVHDDQLDLFNQEVNSFYQKI